MARFSRDPGLTRTLIKGHVLVHCAFPRDVFLPAGGRLASADAPDCDMYGRAFKGEGSRPWRLLVPFRGLNSSPPGKMDVPFAGAATREFPL